MKMMNAIRKFVVNEDGQDLIEYALLVALIAIACIVAVQRAGTSISGVLNNIAGTLEAAV
jgi:Flp pilus assembly pilin Flp